MSLSTFHARLALSSFLAAAALVATNILYFQDPAFVSNVARSKTERVKSRTEAERIRRLALGAMEAPPVTSSVVAQATNAASKGGPPTERTASERAGRFAPPTAQFDKSAAPIPPLPVSSLLAAGQAEPDLRMPEVVKGVQAQLGKKGYEPGPPDGVVGLVTRAAIMAYEHDNGLPLTAEPTETLLRHLQGLTNTNASMTTSRQRPQRAPNAEHILRSVQQTLSQLGYFSSKIDGRNSDETARAIREYEMDAGLTPSGRVSAPLYLKLTRSTSIRKPITH